MPSPQSREKLEEYAKHLDLRKGSDEGYPTSTEQPPRLPVLVRALRGEKVSEEKLDKLIDRLKRE